MTVFLSRSKIIRCATILLLPILFLLHPCTAFSEETIDDAIKPDEELEEELKYLKAETYVITPSKIPQRIEKAPGTIYVVTDRQIRQMGATYLIDVVETVPGWYVWKRWNGDAYVFARGITGAESNEVLFMVNSHPVNNVLNGGAIQLYSYLDLDNVKRIEFVSGPVSSLYGSGAGAGVINIITKEGEDVDGLQLTGRGGSYNTWEGNALFGKTIKDLEVAAYVDYRTTNGFRGYVERDQQSIYDEIYNTHGSIAPGNMKGDAYQWDAQLTLKYKGLKFDGKYIDRQRDWPFGMTPRLDKMSNGQEQGHYLNLSYDVTVTEGLDLMAKLYRNQDSYENNLQTFGKGTMIVTPFGWRVLSDNKFSVAKGKNSRTGAEVQATYEIVDANTILGGLTYEEQRVYDNSTKGNWIPTSAQNVFIPLPTVQDWPDKYVMPNEKRDFWAAYVEDLWDIMEDLRLTIGGRYDHYSDFGGEFSPRVGINWEFAQNFNTKFLYGRAFRAPTFNELYNPWIGNQNLNPEITETYELSFGAKSLSSFSGRIAFFYGKVKDLILTSVVSRKPLFYKFFNYGRVTKKGIELQMKYDFGRGTFISMNYTHLNFDLANPDRNVWEEPKRLGTLTANIRLNRYLNFNTHLLYRGGWTRLEYDTRDDLGDYVLVNATLIAKNFLKELKGLEVRGGVYNLFNKEYISPTAPDDLLPGDVPMPGINFMLELRYTF